MPCRYFIVIDDVWETRYWKKIELALVENDRGSIVIKTTRKSEVATGVIYQLRPLSDDDSKMLLFTRLFDSGGERPANLPAEAWPPWLDRQASRLDPISSSALTAPRAASGVQRSMDPSRLEVAAAWRNKKTNSIRG